MRARPESSTIWRESFFVLTEPGRLHSFDSERAPEPRGTLPVRGGTTAPHDTPSGFAVVGLGKALLFRCDTEEEVRAAAQASGGNGRRFPCGVLRCNCPQALAILANVARSFARLRSR
jgi:hypothetical protein